MQNARLVIEVNADLGYEYSFLVPDGVDFRAHDAVFVLEALVADLKKHGAARVQTASEVAAAKAKIEAAQAILADWGPTLDGVSNMGGVYSRTYIKHGHSEPVVAVCDANGNPTIETADALAKWSPHPETETVAEA